MDLEAARVILLAHARSPKNGIFPTEVNAEAKITNPLCGDHVELKIQTKKEVIKGIGHKARACAICSASSSLLCDVTQGLTVEEALKRGTLFEQTILGEIHAPWPEELGKMECFEHLRVNPARKMCALLPWYALRKAFRPQEEI